MKMEEALERAEISYKTLTEELKVLPKRDVTLVIEDDDHSVRVLDPSFKDSREMTAEELDAYLPFRKKAFFIVMPEKTVGYIERGENDNLLVIKGDLSCSAK
jgi:hypothetical protein